ncbi:hypothetical protein KAU45_04830, partial [bacterium]|nr:hypothetical protein [bacterium]
MSVGETLGSKSMEEIMTGSGGLSSNSGPRRKAEWVVQAMQRLTEACDPETGKRIMQRCSCPYPKKRLKGLKRIYEDGGIRAVVKTIQD